MDNPGAGGVTLCTINVYDHTKHVDYKNYVHRDSFKSFVQ